MSGFVGQRAHVRLCKQEERKEAGVTCFMININELQCYKGFGQRLRLAVPRGEEIRCCVLYFAFELVLFLIKRNHCYGDS